MLPSSTFALCLASGTNASGTLYLGGVPSQPDGSPYDFTYTGPLLQNASAAFSIPSATDVQVNGVSVPGAAADLQADAAGGSTWIVDSGSVPLCSVGFRIYVDARIGVFLQDFSVLLLSFVVHESRQISIRDNGRLRLPTVSSRDVRAPKRPSSVVLFLN